MKNTTQLIGMSPRTCEFLIQVTKISDPETALLKVLTEYTDLKTEQFRQCIRAFELKWKMTFEEFSQQGEAGTLKQDPYSYEVEGDFWEWEQAETLLKYYETLRDQWM